MKNLLKMAVVALALGLLTFCKNTQKVKAPQTKDAKQSQGKELSLDDMRKCIDHYNAKVVFYKACQHNCSIQKEVTKSSYCICPPVLPLEGC